MKAIPGARTLSFWVPGDPVGVNALYRRTGRAVRKTDAARDYHDRIALFGRNARLKAGLHEPWTGPVRVAIEFTFSSERPDLDGPVKTVLDALQAPRNHKPGAGIYDDDKRVRAGGFEVLPARVDKQRPGTQLVVLLLRERETVWREWP